NPSVPGFGGPTGVAEAPSNAGDTVYTYGNSELRGGVTKLSPKQGIVVQPQGNGWSRDVYTVTPGIPGDSGSGFMDATGHAIDVLNTLGEFEFEEHAFGGAAIDAHRTALHDDTLAAARAADAVLLAAVGGPKWDAAAAGDPAAPRPEQGLLGLRKGLGLYANLR